MTREEMSEARDESRRRLLAWAEGHMRALSDLRELERLGLDPERCTGLLVYGEEALRQAAGENDPEKVVVTRLPKVLRRAPFAAFSPRTLWRLHDLLAEAGEVSIAVATDADGRPLSVFSANVKRARRGDLGGKVARRLFNEAPQVKGTTFAVDAARNELRAVLGALQDGAAAGSSVDEWRITAAVADFLEEARRRERPAKRARGAAEADDRVAGQYGLKSGENLRKFIAAARKKVKKNRGK